MFISCSALNVWLTGDHLHCWFTVTFSQCFSVLHILYITHILKQQTLYMWMDTSTKPGRLSNKKLRTVCTNYCTHKTAFRERKPMIARNVTRKSLICCNRPYAHFHSIPLAFSVISHVERPQLWNIHASTIHSKNTNNCNFPALRWINFNYRR